MVEKGTGAGPSLVYIVSSNQGYVERPSKNIKQKTDQATTGVTKENEMGLIVSLPCK